MRNLYIIGAGRSSSAFVSKILSIAPKFGWFITITDKNPEKAMAYIGTSNHARANWLDVTNVNDRRETLSKADLVVSFLPPRMHVLLASECVNMKKKLVAPSTLSYDMFGYSRRIPSMDVFFIYERVIKPGIEIFLVSKLLDEVRNNGGVVKSVHNYMSGGGLTAPKSNPWNYSITWNPMGMITANQGTAQFFEGGKYRYLPYNRIYEKPRVVEIPKLGFFEAIPSRGSFFMEKLHSLEGIDTYIRGTLRNIGFCKAWNALIKLGLTDNSYPIFNSEHLTYQEFVESLVRDFPGTSTRERVAAYLNEPIEGEIMKKIEYLDLFSRKQIRISNATPAQILQKAISEKWKPEDNKYDKSIIYAAVHYMQDGKFLKKSVVLTSKSSKNHTAISRVLGLPVSFIVEKYFKENTLDFNAKMTDPEIYNSFLEMAVTEGMKIKYYDEELTYE